MTNRNLTQETIFLTVELWYLKILPSIPPSFIIGNLLSLFPKYTYPLFFILNKSMHFENQKSCSLFLISIIVGNPTSTILIVKAFKNGEISLFEANRLLRFCSFISLLFIFIFFSLKIALILSFSQIISSFLISLFSHNTKQELENKPLLLVDHYFYIIEKLPSTLLIILSTMIVTSLIKIPFSYLFKIFHLSSLNTILLSFFELTTGLTSLLNAFSKLPLLIFSSALLSFNGIAIILQVFFFTKKTELSFYNFLKYRIIHCILSVIISSVSFYLLFLIF